MASATTADEAGFGDRNCVASDPALIFHCLNGPFQRLHKTCPEWLELISTGESSWKLTVGGEYCLVVPICGATTGCERYLLLVFIIKGPFL